MEPIELVKWAGAVAAAAVALILVYAVVWTIVRDLIVKPRAKRKHLKAMKEFSARLEQLRKDSGLAFGIPKAVLDTFDGGTEAQEQVAKPEPKRQNTKPWPGKPTSPGNGQS